MFKASTLPGRDCYTKVIKPNLGKECRNYEKLTVEDSKSGAYLALYHLKFQNFFIVKKANGLSKILSMKKLAKLQTFHFAVEEAEMFRKWAKEGFADDVGRSNYFVLVTKELLEEISSVSGYEEIGKCLEKFC